MDFPLVCECGKENWVDLDAPQVKRLNSLVSVEEYTCVECKKQIPFFYFTHAMEDALVKLKYSKPSHSSFRYHFQKTLRKALGIRERYNG